MKRLLAFSLLAVLALPPLEVYGLSAAEKGLELAREAYRRDSGFENFTAELKMVLTNRAGKETVRKLRRKSLEVTGDGDKDLTIFDAPADIRGTAMLTYTHPTDSDDQWIFLPAVKRVKRITSANKSGPFVGSEFAYEDIARPEVEKYTYKYIGDEVLGERDCFVLELVPAYEYSGYTRLVQWLDKEIYQPRKVMFYDRKNQLLKTLTFEGYKQYIGQYWRPSEMRMENHQTGKGTALQWEDYQFQVELSDRDFTRNALQRAR